MPRLRPSPRAGCWRWCGLRWGRGSRSERLGPRRHRGCLGHAAGTGAEHGRAKAATMPCLRFLQPRWRPRRTGAAPGPGRSPRALAAFFGAVAGCRGSAGGIAGVVGRGVVEGHRQDVVHGGAVGPTADHAGSGGGFLGRHGRQSCPAHLPRVIGSGEGARGATPLPVG